MSRIRPVSRRDFLSTTAATLALPQVLSAAEQDSAANAPVKTVAFLGTEVRRHSHAQHFLDRLTEGYTWGGSGRSHV